MLFTLFKVMPKNCVRLQISSPSSVSFWIYDIYYCFYFRANINNIKFSIYIINISYDDKGQFLIQWKPCYPQIIDMLCSSDFSDFHFQGSCIEINDSTISVRHFYFSSYLYTKSFPYLCSVSLRYYLLTNFTCILNKI